MGKNLGEKGDAEEEIIWGKKTFVVSCHVQY